MDSKVCFVLYQAHNRSDGGVVSFEHILDGFSPEQCCIISLGESGRSDEWRRKGFIVYEFEHWRNRCARWKKITNCITIGLRIRRVIHKEHADVVHLNDIKAAEQSWPMLLCRRIPTVFTIRDTRQVDKPYSRKWRFAVAQASQVVTLSREMLSNLSRRLPLKLDPENQPPQLSSGEGKLTDRIQNQIKTPATFIYSGLRQPGKQGGSSQLPSEETHLAGTACVLYVGAVRLKKGQLEFLESVGHLITSKYNAHICFLGDFRPEIDPYARACKLRAEQIEHADRIHFLGHRGNVYSWYASACMTVLASKREGLARSMIESLACGTPVVTFDVTSAHEIVGVYDAGIVVPQGDYQSLAEAIGTLLSHDERRVNMGAKGARIAADLFDPERMQEHYRKLYEALTKKPAE